MGQEEIIRFLERKMYLWITTKEIELNMEANAGNVTRALKAMVKQGILEERRPNIKEKRKEWRLIKVW